MSLRACPSTRRTRPERRQQSSQLGEHRRGRPGRRRGRAERHRHLPGRGGGQGSGDSAARHGLGVEGARAAATAPLGTGSAHGPRRAPRLLEAAPGFEPGFTLAKSTTYGSITVRGPCAGSCLYTSPNSGRTWCHLDGCNKPGDGLRWFQALRVTSPHFSPAACAPPRPLRPIRSTTNASDNRPSRRLERGSL
jgi:hypothetical protein